MIVPKEVGSSGVIMVMVLTLRGMDYLNSLTSINFSFRCDGLVEIYWRGKLDHHCTLKSVSSNGTTRFGTSTQLTEKGVNAFRRWSEAGEVRSQIVNALDRLK